MSSSRENTHVLDGGDAASLQSLEVQALASAIIGASSTPCQFFSEYDQDPD
jgi:hypothetical protein